MGDRRSPLQALEGDFIGLDFDGPFAKFFEIVDNRKVIPLALYADQLDGALELEGEQFIIPIALLFRVEAVRRLRRRARWRIH